MESSECKPKKKSRHGRRSQKAIEIKKIKYREHLLKKFGASALMPRTSDDSTAQPSDNGVDSYYTSDPSLHQSSSNDRNGDNSLHAYRVRNGIVFGDENYLEFLRSWLNRANVLISRNGPQSVVKEIIDNISPATTAEKSRFPEAREQEAFVHCDMTISGMPPSVFVGSGFGPNKWLATAAAAKDLIDKCHRIGLISSHLHSAIGEKPTLDRKRKLADFDEAVNALFLSDTKMRQEQWPLDILMAREQESDTLNRLKVLFSSVMEEIYFPGRSSMKLPAAQNDVREITSKCELDAYGRNDHMRTDGPSQQFSRGLDAKGGSRHKEHRLSRFDQPPVATRHDEPLPTKNQSPRNRHFPSSGPQSLELEEKIRHQREELLQGERAREMVEPLEGKRLLDERSLELDQRALIEAEVKRRIDAEMEARRLELEQEIRMRMEAEQRATTSSSCIETTPASAVDTEMEEIGRLVRETEEKLVELQKSGNASALSAIFQSKAFRTLISLGDSAHLLDRRQKQEILSELKALLSEAAPEEAPKERSRCRGSRRSRSRSAQRSSLRDHSRSRSPIPMRQDREHSPPTRTRSKEGDHSEEEECEPDPSTKDLLVHVGSVTLRPLNDAERRRLCGGDMVVTQDMKTGRWTTAHVERVNKDRAILNVNGTATWKKDLTDLYKEA